MGSRATWVFVRSGPIKLNAGEDSSEYPPHEYPFVIDGFLDHDPERKIILPVAMPENEQIAEQLLKLGREVQANRVSNVVHMRTASLDDGGSS